MFFFYEDENLIICNFYTFFRFSKNIQIWKDVLYRLLKIVEIQICIVKCSECNFLVLLKNFHNQLSYSKYRNQFHTFIDAEI